jgi:squalene-associated FAD-dependent desaturase
VEPSGVTAADAVVIGGGFAGLSAAVRLADAGLKVVLVEAAPRLGGRASSFADPETGERVDNGQHVLFGCYRETYAFLERIGSDAAAPLDPRLAVAMAAEDGRVHALSCPALPPPWHLMAGVAKWGAVPLRDRLTARRLAAFAAAVRRDGAAEVARRTDPGLTVTAWLAQHGQAASLCKWLWHPLAVAALNQSPDQAAAAPFVRVLGELFGRRPLDSAVGLPAVPLDELCAIPAARTLEAAGGAILTGAVARIATDAAGQISHVLAGDVAITTRRVVSAVPWHAFSRLWKGDVPVPLSGIAAAAARMEASPIVTVNFWFDRPVMPRRFVGLVGGPMHWAFDKAAILRAPAGHVSVVSSGAHEMARLDRSVVIELATRQMRAVFPQARTARMRQATVVREHRATFSLAPGAPPRPTTRTPLPGLVLAGDWVDTGLPATIESAVLTGRWAAEALLETRP